MANAADHFAKGVGEREGNREEQVDREEVGEPGRVLEGRRGVGVEKTSAVGSELLDRLHEADRTARDGLGHAVQDVVEARRAGQGLDGPLGHEDNAESESDGQEDVEHASRDVDPEVANRRGLATGEAAYHRDRHGDTHGR